MVTYEAPHLSIEEICNYIQICYKTKTEKKRVKKG